MRKLYIRNFDFGKILYEAIFSSLRGYKDIEGVFGWGVCSVWGLTLLER